MSGNWVKNHREIENWKFYKKAHYAHVFQHLIRKAQWKARFNINGQEVKRGELDYSLRQLEEETGVGIKTIRTILKNLEENGEIGTVKKAMNRHELSIISITNYDSFQSNDEDEAQSGHGRGTVKARKGHNFKKENKEKKEKNIAEPLFSDVVNHLNSSTGKKYKATSKTLQRLVKARQGEGFKLEDFIQVIDTKTAEWKNSDMDQYLRPETLFGNKFEGYLNQGNPKNEINNKLIEALGGE